MIRISKSLLIAAMFILYAAYASPASAAPVAAAFQDYGSQGQVITCSSDDGKRHYCNADTSRGVRLGRQISGSACIQGQTWGYDRSGVWVDRGCRAEFYTGGDGRGGQATQGYGSQEQVITCSSNDGKRHYCNADTSRGVRLGRQISGSACIQGQTWGYDRSGVWVDRGCRAEFYTNGGGFGGQRDRSSQTITCSSNNGGRNFCPLNGANPNNVVMTRQISGSECRRGYSWDVDRDNIWVDRGCRAEFQIRR